MILSCSRVTTKPAVIPNSFMNRVNMPLEICLLCCFIITFRAGIPINSMDLTDVLEQVSFLVGCKITLIALEFLVSVNVLNVCF